jgi:hypothetical protein
LNKSVTKRILFFTSSASNDISHDCSKFISNNIANYVSRSWVWEWCLWEATSWSAIFEGAIIPCSRHSSDWTSLSIQFNPVATAQNTAMDLKLEARQSSSLDMQVYWIGHGKDSSVDFLFPGGELWD